MPTALVAAFHREAAAAEECARPLVGVNYETIGVDGKTFRSRFFSLSSFVATRARL